MIDDIKISPEIIREVEASDKFKSKVDQLINSKLIVPEMLEDSEFRKKIVRDIILEDLYPTGIVDSKITPSSPGLAILQRAKKDLIEGVSEDIGKNDGKRIREYFKHFGAGSGQEWCAAAVSAWMKEAGVNIIEGSLSAQEIGRQFKAKNKWVEKSELKPKHLQPGNIAVFSRGEPGSGKGHVGVIESSDDSGKFVSIEGNSGKNSSQVVRNTHSINDGNMLGVGIVSNDKMQANASINNLLKFANIFEKKCLYK